MSDKSFVFKPSTLMDTLVENPFSRNSVKVLKTDSVLFSETFNGRRKYEIRLNDRNFQNGDFLLLLETKFSGEEMESGKPLVYTGRCHYVKVVNILSGYGLKDNWVVMGVDDIKSKYTKL